MKLAIQKKVAFLTSDNQSFDSAEAARAHERTLRIDNTLGDLFAKAKVQLTPEVKAVLVSGRETLKAILKLLPSGARRGRKPGSKNATGEAPKGRGRPRGAKSASGEAPKGRRRVSAAKTATTPAPEKKRRGRPPGSKNKVALPPPPTGGVSAPPPPPVS